MSKTFIAYINENNIGFCIQSYENNIALGIPVCFAVKIEANVPNREKLYTKIEQIKEYVLTEEEKKQIDAQINSLDLNKII